MLVKTIQKLKRQIRQQLGTKLASQMLRENISAGSTVKVLCDRKSYQVAGKAVRLDKMFEIVKNSTLWQESVEFCRILQQQKFKIKFVLPRTSEGSKNG